MDPACPDTDPRYQKNDVLHLQSASEEIRAGRRL